MGDTTVTADQPEETPEQKAAREAEEERQRQIEEEARRKAEEEAESLKPAG